MSANTKYIKERVLKRFYEKEQREKEQNEKEQREKNNNQTLEKEIDEIEMVKYANSEIL